MSDQSLSDVAIARREALRAALRPADAINGESRELQDLEVSRVGQVSEDHYRPGPSMLPVLRDGGPRQEIERLDRERRASVFNLAFTRERLTWEDLRPWRIRAAWRWAREVAEAKLLVALDSLLSEGITPGGWRDPKVGHSNRDRTMAAVQDVVVARVVADDEGRGGVAILPPPLPDEWRTPSGAVRPDYEPGRDAGLLDWMQAFHQVVETLGVQDGSEAWPDAGRWGLRGFDDPKLVRWLFPSTLEIVTWEEVLVRETWDAIVGCAPSVKNPFESKGGLRGGNDLLQRVHGLCARERHRVVAMARRYGAGIYTTDLELDRALAIARLERFVAMVETLDPRAALAAMKHADNVRGLTRSDAEDFTKEVGALIRDMARRPEIGQGPGPQHLLPP